MLFHRSREKRERERKTKKQKKAMGSTEEVLPLFSRRCVVCREVYDVRKIGTRGCFSHQVSPIAFSVHQASSMSASTAPLPCCNTPKGTTLDSRTTCTHSDHVSNFGEYIGRLRDLPGYLAIVVAGEDGITTFGNRPKDVEGAVFIGAKSQLAGDDEVWVRVPWFWTGARFVDADHISRVNGKAMVLVNTQELRIMHAAASGIPLPEDGDGCSRRADASDTMVDPFADSAIGAQGAVWYGEDGGFDVKRDTSAHSHEAASAETDLLDVQFWIVPKIGYAQPVERVNQ